MVIETRRLKIHTAGYDEMVCFVQKQTDDILIKACGEMIQGCLDHSDNWDWYAIWMIELKGGAHMGDLSFKGINSDGSVEIGYGIKEENRGHGYAAEAVDAVVTWALQQPGICRVEAETEPDNTASQRVLKKCGFVPTGIDGEEGPRFVRITETECEKSGFMGDV